MKKIMNIKLNDEVKALYRDRYVRGTVIGIEGNIVTVEIKCYYGQGGNIVIKNNIDNLLEAK